MAIKSTIKQVWQKGRKSAHNSDLWVTLKDIEEPRDTQVWIIDEYDRAERKYLLYNFKDASKCKYVKGDKVCFIDFTF